LEAAETDDKLENELEEDMNINRNCRKISWKMNFYAF
jgi:hypothetical protein